MDLLDGRTGIYLNNEGRLRRFTKGGASFTYITNSLADWGLVDVTAPQTAYIAEGDHFLRTTDGGLTWVPLPGGLADHFLASAFAFTDTQHGFASLANTSGPNIHRTTDGAASWQPTGTQNAWVLAARGSACLAAPPDASFITWTPDDGTTWVTDPSPATFAYPQGGELTPDQHAFLISEGIVYRRSTPLALGLEENSTAGWSVAPKPCTDRIRINAPGGGWLQVLVCDGLGRPVLRARTVAEVDLSALPAGAYVLRIEANGRLAQRSLVKV
jgi:hypothetical protein